MKQSKKSSISAVVLGAGVLNWPREERVGDRYGIVFLGPSSGGYAIPDGTPVESAKTYRPVKKLCEGQRGRLVATVLETRRSGHIGDLFHGISPRTPKVGQEIELGEGTLFFDTREGMSGFGAGLKPDDGRETLWLKIRSLYDCHDQTVELKFYPAE
jgi:hypothetical protein